MFGDIAQWVAAVAALVALGLSIRSFWLDRGRHEHVAQKEAEGAKASATNAQALAGAALAKVEELRDKLAATREEFAGKYVSHPHLVQTEIRINQSLESMRKEQAGTNTRLDRLLETLLKEKVGE